MVPRIRLTHTGLSQGPIRLDDVDFGFEQQNRKVIAYVPFEGSVEIPYTSKSAFSFEQGDIAGFVEGGYLLASLVGFGVTGFSSSVIQVAGSYSLTISSIQRYDASATAPNSIILEFPSNPQMNDLLGLKEVGNSNISILLDGNGNLVEGIGVAPAATQNLNLAFISLIYMWDGLVWRVV